MVRDFFLGILFGLFFSSLAIWILKFSSLALMPKLSTSVFILGGALMGGVINLLLRERYHDTTD